MTHGKRFCTTCGTQLDSGDRFCGRCGNPARGHENPEPTEPRRSSGLLFVPVVLVALGAFAVTRVFMGDQQATSTSGTTNPPSDVAIHQQPAEREQSQPQPTPQYFPPGELTSSQAYRDAIQTKGDSTLVVWARVNDLARSLNPEQLAVLVKSIASSTGRIVGDFEVAVPPAALVRVHEQMLEALAGIVTQTGLMSEHLTVAALSNSARERYDAAIVGNRTVSEIQRLSVEYLRARGRAAAWLSANGAVLPDYIPPSQIREEERPSLREATIPSIDASIEHEEGERERVARIKTELGPSFRDVTGLEPSQMFRKGGSYEAVAGVCRGAMRFVHEQLGLLPRRNRIVHHTAYPGWDFFVWDHTDGAERRRITFAKSGAICAIKEE